MWRTINKRNRYFDEPHEYRILRLVRDSNIISRTEIAHRCGLSKPTVSDIINRFLKAGFLESIGESASTIKGGRKRELLQFNPEAGFVIGIDLRMRECHLAVTDLNANIMEKRSLSHTPGTAPATVIKNLFRSLDTLLRTKRYAKKCVGIGIGLPGLLDRETGALKVADTLAGWTGINLKKDLAERYGYPVYIENDVKVRTLGEYLFGVGKDVWNQVFLWIGDGIGSGIIIDGKLHHGITNSAGEIGYNEIGACIRDQQMFPLLFSGQRDFGEVLANSVILQSYAAHLGSNGNRTIADLFSNAESGCTIAQNVLDEVARLTSIVCINLINTLNPELIVIGGDIAEAGTFVLERVQQKVREDILSVPAEAVRILPAKLHTDGVILGSVGLVLYDLFKPAKIPLGY
ncbi:MAG: ROK family transcriptional regulator [bacterium]